MYKDKLLDEVKEGKRGSSYAGLKKLSMAPGEVLETGFQLPLHKDQGLSNQESVEKIADFCTQVSQEYARGGPNANISGIPFLLGI